MAPVVPPAPNARRRRRAPLPATPSIASLPKDTAVLDGSSLPVDIPAGPAISLSPLEQEILSLCLHSEEDPRDVGVLPALLSVRDGDPRP